MHLRTKPTLCTALLLMLVLIGCGSKKESEYASHITAVVNEAELHELKKNPNLKTLDISGSTCYPAILKFIDDRPQVDVTYTVSMGGISLTNKDPSASLAPGEYDYETLQRNLRYLPGLKDLTLSRVTLSHQQLYDLQAAYRHIRFHCTVELLGKEYPSDLKTVNLSALTSDRLESTIHNLQLLPQLQEAELMDSSATSRLSMTDVKKLMEALPKVSFHYTFPLFGKTLSTADESVEYVNADIGNQGEAQLRQALDIMPRCTYFKLDNCGIDSEVLAALREDYPNTEIVWRVNFGKYSTLTDAEVLRAVYNVYDTTVQELRYCTNVKYIDMGHNESLTDIRFMAHMPKLEIVIVSGSAVSDISCFENCPNLEFLEIAHCGNLQDISPLKSCENLRFLNISFSKVEDLSPLDSLPLDRFVCLKPKASQEEQERFKELHLDCWTRFTGSDPYTLGWRYDDQGETFSEYYRKMREIFHYDEMND